MGVNEKYRITKPQRSCRRESQCCNGRHIKCMNVVSGDKKGIGNYVTENGVLSNDSGTVMG